jgi:hypothetical protein
VRVKQCLLYELHSISGGSVNIELLLIELADNIGITGECILTPEALSLELHPKVADSNYFISYVSSHGCELSVTLSKWITSKSQPSPDCAHMLVHHIRFRPTYQKKLNIGKWGDWESFNLYRLFWEEFKTLGFESPVEVFTDKGKADLLSYFAWTKLSLMSRQEARAARVQHLKKRPHLRGELSRLALTLKESGLYSTNTAVSQIKKSLPSLLKEAFPVQEDK